MATATLTKIPPVPVREEDRITLVLDRNEAEAIECFMRHNMEHCGYDRNTTYEPTSLVASGFRVRDALTPILRKIRGY